MKKRTVITTEKRETWIIRQYPNDVVESTQDSGLVSGNTDDLLSKIHCESEAPAELQGEDEQ